jgi:hypothetical protein
MGNSLVWTLATGGGRGTDVAEPASIGMMMITVAAALAGVLLVALVGRRRARSRARRPFPPAVGLAGLLLLAPAGRAAAEEPKLQVGGFVDGVFAYNLNRPADHANFLPGLGTSAKRDNEVTVNLAQVDVVLAPEPVGFKLSLGFGNAPEVVHAAEVRGMATSPEVWRHVVQASVQWQTKAGRGLLLEAGVFPSHIGMESFQTHLNWNYTRSWLGELSPYYQTGLKAAYPFSDRWSGQLHLLNGWQVIGDNNRGKTVGAQLAYAADKFSLSLNGIAGPELAENDDDVRVLIDGVATWKTTPSLSLGLSVDAAREGRPDGSDVGWWGAGLYARLAPPSSRTALALRGEYYDDEDGAISGIAQTLKELTVTLEHRPVERLILKLEGRYDTSSALAFADDTVGEDGAPLRRRNQFLVLLGAVARF